MAALQVTCITKRGNHYDPHERIQALGGAGWYHSEAEAIANIERGIHSYYVNVGGRVVPVVVAIHNGRKYLKTAADGYGPNNLLALPECRR